MDDINTSNCRKLAMKLNREGVSRVDLGNVTKLFEGSKADRLNLLRQYLASGKNLEKVAAYLEFKRQVEQEEEGVEMLLTVAQMRKEDVSELFG